MARGRMVNKEIVADSKIDKLSCDTSRLAFTWLVAFADKDGRVRGDPSVVCSMLFPRRRNEITTEDMESYIAEWANLGLVIWYEAEDDMWIWFPAFEKNQIGLRRDREPDSIIPPYTDDCRIISGKLPDNFRQTSGKLPDNFRQTSGKLPDNFRQTSGVREGKGREGNDASGGTQQRELDTIRGEIEKYFSELTKIPLPPRGTEKQRREAAIRWWNPIREILSLAGGDVHKAKKLVSQSYHQMRDGPKPLTVASPQSILQVAISIKADWDRNGDGERIVVDM